MSWRSLWIRRLVVSCFVLAGSALSLSSCGAEEEERFELPAQQLAREGLAAEASEDLVRALWYFERARRHAPRSEALGDKLEDLQLRLGLPLGIGGSVGTPQATWSAPSLSLSEQWWTSLTLQVIALGLLVWAWRRGSQRGRGVLTASWPMGLAAIMLIVSVLCILRVKSYRAAETDRMMIMEHGVALYQAPHARAGASEELRAGSIVTLEEASDRWLCIRLDGSTGWIRRESASFIPR